MADTQVHDLFLSYRRADEPRLEALLAALQALSVSIWRDTREIEDFSSVQQSINAGLGRSRALLVWYSAAYNASRACQWELTTGYLAAQADPATGGDPRRRVLVVNPEPGNDHIHLPELFDQQWLAAPPAGDDVAVQALARRIHSVLQFTPATPLGKLKALTPPRWFPHMGTGSTRFVGRLAQMWQLHGHLQAGEAAMLTGAGGRPALAQVRGAGGIGKSLMAEEYALRYGAAYPGGVFWLRAYGYTDSERSLTIEQRRGQRDSQLADIAARLGIDIAGSSPAEVAGLLGLQLGRAGQPFLWVVDDLPAELGDEGITPWLAPHPLGRTLVTTRARRFNHLHAVELPQLDEAEAVRLLTRGRALNGEDESLAREVCQTLGHHALAVDVAAALVERRGLAAFLASLQREDRDALELAATGFSEALPNGHERSIAATLLASLRELDEPALDLLRLAALLAAAPIPRDLLWRSLAQADSLSDEDAQDRCDPALARVCDSSLGDPSDGGGLLVHTLVLRTLSFHDMVSDRQTALRQGALNALLAEMPRVADIREHQSLAEWVPHAREMGSEPADRKAATLLGWVARHDLEQGRFAIAAAAYAKQLVAIRRLLGEEHPDTLTSMQNLADTLRNQGDLAGARRLEETVLDARRRLLGEEHPDTLTSMNNLAITLHSQGDLAGTRRLQEVVLEAARRRLGEEHPDTLTSMSNLGITLSGQGDLASARRLQEAELAICRRLLGEEHPNTLISMNNLANTLLIQRDLAGARRLQETVLEARRRLQGLEHPSTLHSMNSLASMLRHQGDLAGARQLDEAVLEASRRLLGEEHPDTLTSMNNLACTLYSQGDLTGAQLLQEVVLEASRRLLGKEHQYTLSSMNNLANILRNQGNLADARRLEEGVYETRQCLLGKEHPDTLTSMNNLAVTLALQGEWISALPLQQRAAEALAQHLGPDHSNTKAAFSRLAAMQAAAQQSGAICSSGPPSN